MLHDIYVIETRFQFVSLYMHPCTSKKIAKGSFLCTINLVIKKLKSGCRAVTYCQNKISLLETTVFEIY
jgi:hypothetical protein